MLTTERHIDIAKNATNKAVNDAFSKQSIHFDSDDQSNPILKLWRKRVYNHVNQYIKPSSTILEINAGTGIDALYFVKQGHIVHTTDLSTGMISQIKQKSKIFELKGRLTYQQCSFEELDSIGINKVDYLFSNFGGLNCTNDLSKVTCHFPQLLNPEGIVTLVIMPPFSPWELLWVFKGKLKQALRRLSKQGTLAHLENENFRIYYHSISSIKKALGTSFQLIKCESLGVCSPPPGSVQFHAKHPRLTKLLERLDTSLANIMPFNRWGDHIIATYQYNPSNLVQSQ